MFINQNISLRRVVNAMVFVAAALTGLLVSCVQIEQNNEGTGYISFNPLSVDVAVEGLELTKASVPADKIPGDDDFTYTIVSETDGHTYYSAQGLPADPIPLPVGTYKVDAVYGANEFNQAYYTASVDNVQIEEDKTNNINFGEITLDNAMVAVTLPDMTGHMEINSISLSDGENTIPVESGKYYFAPAGQGAPSVTASFSGVNSLGEKKTVSQNLGVLEPQHAYNLVCNLELPSFTFEDQSSGAIAGRLYLTSLAELGGGLDASKIKYQISSDGGSSWKQAVPAAKDGYWVISQTNDGSALASDGTSYQIRAVCGGLVAGPWTFTPSMPVNTLTGVSIAHTYESRSFTGLASALSVLTGSVATVGGTDTQYSGIVATLISSKGSRGVRLIKGSTEVGALTGKETGNMSVADGWTYLPQGTYTAVPFFRIGDETFNLSEIPVTREDPVFTVTAYAETSYSRYLNYKNGMSGYTLELANTSGTAEKIMGIRGIVSISDDVLSKNAGLISGVTLKYGDSSMLSSGTAVTTSVWYPNTEATKVNDTNWELTGRSWGSHTITASFTFDGVAAKSSTDPTSTVSTLQCHITGLPYSYDFYRKSIDDINNAGWNSANASYTVNKCAIPYDSDDNAYLISSDFFIPSGTISTSYTVNAQYYVALGSSGAKNHSTDFYVGATSSNASMATSYNTHTCIGNNSTGKSYSEFSGNITLSQESKYVSISHTDNDYKWAIDYLCVYDFMLRYAQ